MSGLPTRLAPVPLRVLETLRETADSVTLALRRPPACGVAAGAPGQFNMLYPFGVGEAAISLSSDAGDGDVLVHTVRGVGAVSEAIGRLQPGEWLGVRGPFGLGWPMQRARGRNVVLVAGGIGLAPLRPVIHAVLRERAAFGRLFVFYGARTPRERLFVAELEQWQSSPDIDLAVTLDSGDANWGGRVGFVTALLPLAQFDPAQTIVMTCGPEVMMRAVANQVIGRGVAPGDVYVSLERNMKCAAGLCGHCQFGPLFICKDGPVFTYDRVETLLRVREI
jgi:NAD(P)H-flavin reductase